MLNQITSRFFGCSYRAILFIFVVAIVLVTGLFVWRDDHNTGTEEYQLSETEFNTISGSVHLCLEEAGSDLSSDEGLFNIVLCMQGYDVVFIEVIPTMRERVESLRYILDTMRSCIDDNLVSSIVAVDITVCLVSNDIRLDYVIANRFGQRFTVEDYWMGLKGLDRPPTPGD